MVRLLPDKKPDSTTPKPFDPSRVRIPGFVSEEGEALDKRVLAVVQKLDVDRGARWDDVIEAVLEMKRTDKGYEDKSNAVEESFNRLMDKWLIYEPTLGILKVV